MSDCHRNCGRCDVCRRNSPGWAIAAWAFCFAMLGLNTWVNIVLPALAAPVGVAQNVQISSQVAMGLQSVYPETLMQYQEPTTTTAQFSGATTVTIPANTSDNAVSIATLFPAFATPICIGLEDVTSGGVALNVGTDSGGTKIHMAANGMIVYRTADGTPVFFVDNSTNTDAALRVFGLSN